MQQNEKQFYRFWLESETNVNKTNIARKMPQSKRKLYIDIEKLSIKLK